MLVAFGIATVAFDIVLVVIDRRLEATGGPSILGLEFAGSEQRVTQIIGEWGAHGQHLARLSLWLDFGFMLSYGTFFTLAALATRDFARERGLQALVVGIATPFLAAAAALYDAALGEALELKPGAREALEAARRAGLSVMVVSEGPHDAQATTIERLGIAPSIDLLRLNLTALGQLLNQFTPRGRLGTQSGRRHAPPPGTLLQ